MSKEELKDILLRQYKQNVATSKSKSMAHSASQTKLAQHHTQRTPNRRPQMNPVRIDQIPADPVDEAIDYIQTSQRETQSHRTHTSASKPRSNIRFHRPAQRKDLQEDYAGVNNLLQEGSDIQMGQPESEHLQINNSVSQPVPNDKKATLERPDKGSMKGSVGMNSTE